MMYHSGGIGTASGTRNALNMRSRTPKSAIPVGFMQRLYIAVDTMAEEIGYSYVVSASLTLRLSMRRLTSMAVRGRERSGKADCCSR